MLGIAIIAILLLTSNPVVGDTHQPRHTKDSGSKVRCLPGKVTSRPKAPDISLIKAWLHAYALEYKVEPAFLMAVGNFESRRGKQEFRVGEARHKGQTYWLPMAIHNDFLIKRGWQVDDPEENIRRGAKALQGVGYDEVAQRRRYHNYNKTCDEATWQTVVKLKKKYQREIAGLK